MKKLNEIKYQFVIDLTKFFIGKYNDGEIKELDSIVRNVMALSKFIVNMCYVYDETIWRPDEPESHKNLIEFKVQLFNEFCYLPFRLYINKGANQEAILLNNLNDNEKTNKIIDMKEQIFRFIELKTPNLLEVLSIEIKDDDDNNGFIGEYYTVRCILQVQDTSIPICNTLGRKEKTCLVNVSEFRKWVKCENSIIWC